MAGVPSIVRHHFLILAVPVDDVRAEARMVKLPEAFEPSRVDQETVGAVFEKLIVRFVVVAVLFEVSVTVIAYVLLVALVRAVAS